MWWLVVAAMLIGFGVRLRYGTGHPLALTLVVAAFLIIMVRPWKRRWGSSWIRLVAVAIGCAQLAVFAVDAYALIIWGEVPAGARISLIVLLMAVVVTSLCIVVGYVARARWLWAFLASHLLLAIALVLIRDPVTIDVLVFHEDAASAMLQGTNPFAITFPDPYPPAVSSAFYGTGVSIDGVLQFGYPYPPLNLLVVLMGRMVSDVRLILILAAAISAALLPRISGSSVGPTLAVLLLTNASFLHVTSQGWTEPVIVVALASAVLAARLHPRLMPWLFGLVLGLKQYMVLFAPLYVLFLGGGSNRRRWAKDVAIAVMVPVLTMLPFLVLNADAFMWSVVELQFHQPYRPESLSVLAAVHNATGWPPESIFGVLPFLAASAASLWVLRRGDQSIRGLTYGIVVVSLSFLLVSKQAFANYYFFTIGAAFVAAAAAHLDRPPAHLVETGTSAGSGQIA